MAKYEIVCYLERKLLRIPPMELTSNNNDNNQLTQRVIGCAMTVLNSLKPGLDEKLYERALVIELEKLNVSVESQKQFEVTYDGHPIGTLIPDLLVENTLIVDTKVVTSFNDSHVAQMLGYLNITGFDTALLLNFKYAKLGIKRVSLSKHHTDN